jgi:hypothetical protein
MQMEINVYNKKKKKKKKMVEEERVDTKAQ